jgi:protein involved in polysaccharide export with SLBB domain
VLGGLAILGAILLTALNLSGCESCQTAPDTGYEHLNDEIEQSLTRVGLGPGDVFEVTVYGEESLSRTLRVSPEGTIHFPLIETVNVQGLTPSEIEDQIRTRLKDGFIRDPSVTVFVKEYNSKKIFVLGEVARPGTFPFVGGINVVEAITLAGGFKDSANTNYVVVSRRGPEGVTRIPIPVERITEGRAENLNLQPGDIVYVPDTLL